MITRGLPLMLLLFAGCDLNSELNVTVLEDGPDSTRAPLTDATVSVFNPRLALPTVKHVNDHGYANYLTFSVMSYDFQVTVEAPGHQPRSYLIGDLCVTRDETAPGGCREAFLYAPLPKL